MKAICTDFKSVAEKDVQKELSGARSGKQGSVDEKRKWVSFPVILLYFYGLDWTSSNAMNCVCTPRYQGQGEVIQVPM